MIVAGRAMTVLEADTVQGDAQGRSEQMRRSVGLMLEALDDLKENEVYLCSGSSPRYALVGELMCTRMQKLGAAGAVVNTFTTATPGHFTLDELSRQVQLGIEAAGGTAMRDVYKRQG